MGKLLRVKPSTLSSNGNYHHHHHHQEVWPVGESVQHGRFSSLGSSNRQAWTHDVLGWEGGAYHKVVMIILMMMMARTEYMRWKYRNNKEDKISVDESGMTQFDPLLKWEVTIMMVIYQLTIIKNRCKMMVSQLKRTTEQFGRCNSAGPLGKPSSISSSLATGQLSHPEI